MMSRVGGEGSDEWLTNAISRIDRIYLKLVVTNIDLSTQLNFLYWFYSLAHLPFDVNDVIDSDFSGHFSLSISVMAQHLNWAPLRAVLSPPWSAIRTRMPHIAKQLLQNLYSPHFEESYLRNKFSLKIFEWNYHKDISSSYSLMKFWD